MDFQDILAQASHNAQKANKVVSSLNQEANEQRQRKREQYERELIREREERRRKAPPKVEKKFVIPKKINPDKEVDSNALQRFKDKQRQEAIEKEKQRQKDCDKLIGLRLQANQGRASKKIASQFGKTAIELQQRYAPNSHMELELLKRDQREKEELERSTTALRNSIYKAKCDRAGALAQQRAKGPNKEKARIGNVRAGGFSDVTSKQEAVLTKRKAENFSTFSSSREKEKPKKPRIAPSTGQVMDFKAIMEQAQQNSNVQNVAARSDQILRSQQSSSSLPNSREVMKRAMIEQRTKPQQPPTKPAPSSKSAFQQHNSSSSSNRRDVSGSSGSASKQLPKVVNPYALSDRQVLGPPSASSSQRSQAPVQKKPNRGDRPLPATPQPPPKQVSQKEQRFLPGDVRYQGLLPVKSSASSSSQQIPTSSGDRFKRPLAPSSSSTQQSSMSSREKQSISKKQRAASPTLFATSSSSSKQQQSSAQRHRDLFGESSQRYEKSSSMRKPERRAEPRPMTNPAMFGKRGNSYSNGYNYNNHSDDEEEDSEDEYDSEMDDFIDDSELNELETADFEESLRSVNRNYNKNLWKARERMIDERGMEARYRDIEAEEKRSSRMALMEDFQEAQKGSRGLV